MELSCSTTRPASRPIPIMQGATPINFPQMMADAGVHKNRTHIKILLAEDRDEDRQLLGEFLMEQGYSVFLATNGNEAVSIAGKVVPDLILLDVQMPDCDGYTAAFQLRQLAVLEKTPIMFITAAATPQNRVAGLRLGAVDYITKPYDFEELALRMEIHLGYLLDSKNPAPAVLAPAQNHTQRLDQALFQAASASMQANLARDFTQAELAAELRTSSKRLNAAFKACANKTLFEYLRDLRMQEACRLLQESWLDIGAIAQKVGYGSPANFSTAFKAQTGMSPREYRNQASPE